MSKPRQQASQGIWLVRDTGTGKSKIAHLIGQYVGDYFTKDSTKWWDHYDGQQYIIVDDYRGEWQPQYILTTVDRYPKLVEYKGGYQQLQGTFFLFTSNKTMEECYSQTDKRTMNALQRRIKQYVTY